MFAYLKGTLVSATATQVILEVRDIGYTISIPCSLIGQLPAIGNSLQLYTSFVIREFSQTLYGFLNAQERDIFEVLMDVTGIGPKLALSLIGHLPLQNLQAAVTHEDIPTLCKVPGVGKKTAERLIVELRDKLSALMTAGIVSTIQIQSNDPRNQQNQDAMAALMQLGYSQSIAQKAIRQALKDMPEESDLGNLIKAALRHT